MPFWPKACARLAYYGHDPSRVIDFLLQGSLTADFSAARAAARISRLMKRYADCPMDFAEACLVVMTEQLQDCVVVTLDAKDFSVYRRHDREVIPLISPARA